MIYQYFRVHQDTRKTGDSKLQNCLRPACQVWWVRFPRSPANPNIYGFLTTSFIHRPEGTRSFFIFKCPKSAICEFVPFIRAYHLNNQRQFLQWNPSGENRYPMLLEFWNVPSFRLLLWRGRFPSSNIFAWGMPLIMKSAIWKVSSF